MCRFLERATIFQICGNAGGTESVATYRRINPGRLGAALNHGIGIRLGQGGIGKHARSSANRPEQRVTRMILEASGLHIVVQVLFKAMMARHFVDLAALFVQPHPQTTVLHIHVMHFHRERNEEPTASVID